MNRRFFKFFICICIACTSSQLLAYANKTDITEVEVVVPRQINSANIIQLTGTIEASQHAQISALEAGIVSSIMAEVGDAVQKGQTLLSIDSSLVKLSVDAAKASLQAASINLEESKRLYQEVLALSKKQVVAETLISQRAALLGGAEAALAQEQANLALQEALLSRHVLRAPFSGVVTTRNTELGEWLNVQDVAFELVNTNDLRLNLAIAQEYYEAFMQMPNINVNIQPDSGGANINAKVSRIVPLSDNINRSFLVQVDLPAKSGLIAGMSARASIELHNAQTREIILPRSALKLHPDGGSSVFIVQNGVAKRLLCSYRNLTNSNVAVQLPDPADYNNKFVITKVTLLKDGDRLDTIEVSNGLTND